MPDGLPFDLETLIAMLGENGEGIDDLTNLGGLGGKMQLLKDQQKYAEALRDTPTPQARRPSQDTYVAPHPLEYLGAFAQKAVGHGMSNQGDKDMMGLINQQSEGRGSVLRRLLQGYLGKYQGGDTITPYASGIPSEDEMDYSGRY